MLRWDDIVSVFGVQKNFSLLAAAFIPLMGYSSQKPKNAHECVDRYVKKERIWSVSNNLVAKKL